MPAKGWPICSWTVSKDEDPTVSLSCLFQVVSASQMRRRIDTRSPPPPTVRLGLDLLLQRGGPWLWQKKAPLEQQFEGNWFLSSSTSIVCEEQGRIERKISASSRHPGDLVVFHPTALAGLSEGKWISGCLEGPSQLQTEGLNLHS